jgi:hypothetical protein
VRIIIECLERILHLKAGYIYADCPFADSTLLQSGGGPYIFAIHEVDGFLRERHSEFVAYSSVCLE